MSCSNCYNGCSEIVSDKCVKYTGIDVPVLGIKNGDSLSYVEQSIIGFLTSTLDGTGIKLNIDPAIICTVVKQYLPSCTELNLVDVTTALIKAACSLQTKINNINSQLNVIEAPYTIGCLTGVTSTSGTHSILQAVVTKLCEVEEDLALLAEDVDTNYVKLADLNTLIAAYLSGTPGATKYYTRMIPYTVVEYYGDLTGKFDGTGKGLPTTEWENIYLCNGLNGTPDKRGRLPVGAIVGVGGGTLNPVVNPLIDPLYNPNYAVGTTAGENSVTLLNTQIPQHSHTATSTATSTDHTHLTALSGATQVSLTGSTPIKSIGGGSDASSYTLGGIVGTPNIGLTSPSKSDVSVTTTVNPTGGSLPHNNVPPVLACYYIMYIP